MNIPVLNGQDVSLCSSEIFSKSGIYPLHTSFYQCYDFKYNVGLSKVNIKLKIFPSRDIYNFTNQDCITNLENINFLNFGLAYKYYQNKISESYPIVDFSLLNGVVLFEEKFSRIAFIKLIEHESQLELIQNYNWAQIGLGYGYNFLKKEERMYLVPLLHLNLGLNSYKIDTLIFNNIDKSNLSTQYTIAEYGMLLYFQFKRFSIEANIKKYINFGEIKRTSSFIKASYRINENLLNKYLFDNNKTELRFVGFEFSYQNEKYEFASNDLNTLNLNSVIHESFNFSLNFNLDLFSRRIPFIRECGD